MGTLAGSLAVTPGSADEDEPPSQTPSRPLSPCLSRHYNSTRGPGMETIVGEPVGQESIITARDQGAFQ